MAAVETESTGSTFVITLNRPEARNAVNGDIATGLEAAVDEFEANPDLWTAVLCGNGPVFCAGADLKEVAKDGGRSIATKRNGFAGFVQNTERTKPIIAAIDGPALAGGTEIMLACDLTVASRISSFGIPEVKRSLVAAAGGLFRLPQMIPARIALELALTGDPIDAERAYELGLVNVLCDEGESVDRALAFAERINVNAPLAVRASRRVMLDGMGVDESSAFDMAGAAMRELAATADFAEGPKAFIEKRPAVWTGR